MAVLPLLSCTTCSVCFVVGSWLLQTTWWTSACSRVVAACPCGSASPIGNNVQPCAHPSGWRSREKPQNRPFQNIEYAEKQSHTLHGSSLHNDRSATTPTTPSHSIHRACRLSVAAGSPTTPTAPPNSLPTRRAHALTGTRPSACNSASTRQRVRSSNSNDGEFSRLSHCIASADHSCFGSSAAHVVTAVSSSAPPSWPQ